jgi:hypothetical protein
MIISTFRTEKSQFLFHDCCVPLTGRLVGGEASGHPSVYHIGNLCEQQENFRAVCPFKLFLRVTAAEFNLLTRTPVARIPGASYMRRFHQRRSNFCPELAVAD